MHDERDKTTTLRYLLLTTVRREDLCVCVYMCILIARGEERRSRIGGEEKDRGRGDGMGWDGDEV